MPFAFRVVGRLYTVLIDVWRCPCDVHGLSSLIIDMFSRFMVVRHGVPARAGVSRSARGGGPGGRNPIPNQKSSKQVKHGTRARGARGGRRRRRRAPRAAARERNCKVQIQRAFSARCRSCEVNSRRPAPSHWGEFKYAQDLWSECPHDETQTQS